MDELTLSNKILKQIFLNMLDVPPPPNNIKIFIKGDTWPFLTRLYLDLYREIRGQDNTTLLLNLIEAHANVPVDIDQYKYILAKSEILMGGDNKDEARQLCGQFIRLLQYIAKNCSWNLNCDAKYFRVIGKRKILTSFVGFQQYLK